MSRIPRGALWVRTRGYDTIAEIIAEPVTYFPGSSSVALWTTGKWFADLKAVVPLTRAAARFLNKE